MLLRVTDEDDQLLYVSLPCEDRRSCRSRLPPSRRQRALPLRTGMPPAATRGAGPLAYRRGPRRAIARSRSTEPSGARQRAFGSRPACAVPAVARAAVAGRVRSGLAPSNPARARARPVRQRNELSLSSWLSLGARARELCHLFLSTPSGSPTSGVPTRPRTCGGLPRHRLASGRPGGPQLRRSRRPLPRGNGG